MNIPYVRFFNDHGDEIELSIYMRDHNKKYNFKNIINSLKKDSYREIQYFDLKTTSPKEYFPFKFDSDRVMIYSQKDLDGLYVFDYPNLKFRNGITQKDKTICI